MANFQFNVNTDATIILTAKLERLNKTAFPNAVRSTLSDGAFAMKQGGILASAKKNMKVKNENFFKANTGVVKARGRNVNQMEAISGFTNKRGEKANKAVNYGMEANEFGDTDDSGLKYYPATRGSRGMVRRSQYYDKENITESYLSSNLKTKKQNRDSYTVRAFASLKDKKPVFVNTRKGRALIKVSAIKKRKSGKGKGSLRIMSKLLMMDRTQKKARAKATHFNREAALTVHKKMDEFYAKNAQFQFDRVLKSTI